MTGPGQPEREGGASDAPRATEQVVPVAARDGSGWMIPAAAGLILAAIVGLLFRDFFGRQLQWAIRQQADWGHTLIIPAIAGWFVWRRREELLARPFRTSWTGFVPILLGVAWYSLCVFGPAPLHHHNLRAAGVATTILGIVILFCGYRSLAILWFPLLYLFVFGQTISDRFMEVLTFRLQDITARGAHLVLALLRFDVDREGNSLIIVRDGVPMPLNVAEACSGMRMLMSFLALGAAMAYTGLDRWWQRILLILLGVPTAVFVNVLRVVTLGLLAMVDSGLAAGDFHSFVGLLWLVPAFIIYLGVMWVVRNLVTEAPAGAKA